MKTETVEFACGVVSSKEARLDLIPIGSLERLAARFQLGIERKGDKVWNSSSTNNAALLDKDFIIDRCVHAITHAYKLINKVRGKAEGDEDDDAAAIMWAGSFLCEATAALKEQRNGDLLKVKAELIPSEEDFDKIFPPLPDSIKFLTINQEAMDKFNSMNPDEMTAFQLNDLKTKIEKRRMGRPGYWKPLKGSAKRKKRKS